MEIMRLKEEEERGEPFFWGRPPKIGSSVIGHPTASKRTRIFTSHAQITRRAPIGSCRSAKKEERRDERERRERCRRIITTSSSSTATTIKKARAAIESHQRVVYWYTYHILTMSTRTWSCMCGNFEGKYWARSFGVNENARKSELRCVQHQPLLTTFIS